MKILLSVTLLIAAAAMSFAQTLNQTSNPAVTKGATIITKKPADTVSYPYDAGRVRYLANESETGGAWSAVELIESAGYKTPLHRHPDMDEAFYILEGVLTARIADKTREFGPGSFVLIPRGTVHAQGNFGKSPVKLLVMVSPGGLEQFFADRVELFKDVRPGHPDFEKRITEVIAKNHIEVLGTWEL